MTDQIVEKHVGSWAPHLKHLFYDKRMDETFKAIKDYTPEAKWIFRAFKECPYDEVKLVIVGQDPYPQKGVADGLAFSCSRKGTEERSLRIIKDAIYKEGIHDFEPVDWLVTDLKYLANQGVLLLNSALTCVVGNPGTHYKEWEWFVRGVLEVLQTKNLQYILYGKKAQELSTSIVGKVHKGYHPIAQARSGGQYKFKTYFPETKLKIQWLPIKDDHKPEDFEWVDYTAEQFTSIFKRLYILPL